MKNKDYWQNRAVALENLMQKNTNQTMIAINKIYQKASDSLTRKVNKIFTRYVTGGKINPEYAKQLLNEKQTREYRNELKKLLAETKDEKLRREIINTLDAPAYSARISRLEALRDNLYYEARAIGAKEAELAESRFANVYQQSYYRTIYADQKNSGLYDFDILTDRRIQAMLAHEWNGGNYSSRLWKNNEDFAERVAETIETGCLAGWTLDEMCNELKGRVVGDTTDRGQRYITSRLIRTEVNYFSNQGTLEGLKAAGFTKYRFIATLDLRTSEMCRKLDLKVFNIDDAEIGVNLPPLHPFCRSVIVPAYENEDRISRTRWARNPLTGKGMKVPANMSYDDWYKKYVAGNGLKNIVNNSIINQKNTFNSTREESYPITKKSLENVSNTIFEEFSNDVNNKIYQQRKLLLERMQNEKTGKEGSVVISTDGTIITDIHVGKLHSTGIENLNIEYYGIHNHPDNGVLSPDDIMECLVKDKMIGIESIGNNGTSLYSIRKTEFCDYGGYAMFIKDKIDYLYDKYGEKTIADRNIQEYYDVSLEILERAKDYGFKTTIQR